MLSLIRYELKKAFASSFLKILLFVLLLVNVLLCTDFADRPHTKHERPLIEKAYQEYKTNPEEFYRGYEDLLRYYQEASSPANPFPQDPYRFQGKAWDIRDWDVYTRVLEDVEAGDRYRETISSILSQSEGIRKDLDEDSYAYRYLQKLDAVYSSLPSRSEFKGEPIYGWDLLFSYQHEYFPVLLLLISVCVYLCLCDRQNGFYAIASVCKKGRTKTALAKLTAILILSWGTVILFGISTFCTIGAVTGGYSTPFEAVQALQRTWPDYSNMIFFPFAMNLWQGYLFCLFYRCLAVSLPIFTVFAISMLLKSTPLSLGIGTSLSVLCYLIPNWEKVGNFTQWRHLALRSLYVPNLTLSRYRAVDILGYSVDLNTVFFALSILFLGLALFAGLAFYSKKRIGGRKKRFKLPLGDLIRKLRPRYGSLSLPRFELKKNRVLYFLIPILVIIKILSASQYYQPDTTSYDSEYKSYIEGSIGGVYTEEKAKQIRFESEWYTEVVQRFNEMNDKYFNNEISSEEFMRYMRDYSTAELKLSVLKGLEEQSSHLEWLKEERQIIGSFIYDTGFSRFVKQGPDLLLLFFFSLLGAQQYLNEYKKNLSGSSMYVLVQSTKQGRGKLFTKKLIQVLVTVVPLWAISKGIDLYFLLKNFTLPELNSPLAGMKVYGSAPAFLTVQNYLIGIAVFSLLGTLLIAAIAFLAGFFIKRSFLVYALIAAVILIPHYASKSDISLCRYLDLTVLHNTDQLFRQFHFVGFCLVFILITASVIAGMLLAKRKVQKGHTR